MLIKNDIPGPSSYQEVQNLIKRIYDEYGYDFSEYSPASLNRRIARLMNKFRISEVGELERKIAEDSLFFNKFIEEITVNVTEMFRDPYFYYELVQEIFPVLEKLPMIKIWHAGCSTGEEVYSMAILLKEAGLLHKSLLYGTDINQSVLEIAMKGIYSVNNLKEYSENYLQSGGKGSLLDHVTVRGNEIKMDSSLTKRMVFAHHNLAIDQSFNEFNLILCRNVMIYFNRSLQDKVFKLFYQSISDRGFLALGTKETIKFSSVSDKFIETDKRNKIWKKKES